MSKIINFARAQVGKPYVFGTSGPKSFDCSGLTKRAAAQIGLDLYHGATKQWNRGTETGPPVNDDAPSVDEAALLTELEGLNKRQAVIIAALRGVM